MKDESFGNESFGEEIGNTITHGVMAVAVLLLLPFAVVKVFSAGGEKAIIDTVGVSIFCLCMFFMFATSATYHSTMKKTTHKLVYNKLDHIAIFFAIAGTYTPLSLSVIGGTKGIILIVIQWSMVLAGILLKVFMWMKSRLLSVPVYLIMGWSIVIFFKDFKDAASPQLFWLIVSGGLAYSLGCIFYATKFKFSHMVFHIFVNIGAILHFIGVVFFMRT